MPEFYRRQICAALAGLAVADVARAQPAKLLMITEQMEFDIYFPPQTSYLTPDGLAALKKASDYILATYTPDLTQAHVVIVGYADASDAPSDLIKLSEARAKHVADALVAAGVKPDIIAVDWKGDTEPSDILNGMDKASANRHVGIFPAY